LHEWWQPENQKGSRRLQPALAQVEAGNSKNPLSPAKGEGWGEG